MTCRCAAGAARLSDAYACMFVHGCQRGGLGSAAMATQPDPETFDETSTLMACAVCAEVLFPRTDHGEVVSWLHRAELTDAWGEAHGIDLATIAAAKERLGHRPVDHVAIPVRRDEVQAETKCDFCSQPNPTWVLPVASFSADAVNASTQDWSACEVCARLLKKSRWEQLTNRAITAMSARHGLSPSEPRLVLGLKALHAQVREHQTGPVRRA